MPKKKTMVTPEADRYTFLSSVDDKVIGSSAAASDQSDPHADKRSPWILSSAGSEGAMESIADSDLRAMMVSDPSVVTKDTAENKLQEPLLTRVERDLNRNNVESSITSDDERPSIGTEYCCYRPTTCCKSFCRDRWFIGICFFAIQTWIGFLFAIWSTWTCNLVHITWYPSQTFRVTGVGLWRYQETTKKKTANGMVKEVICMDYESWEHHSEISNAGSFFPEDIDENRAFSVVSPTLAGIVFVALMVVMIVASAQPDKFMNHEFNPQYPWKALSTCYILAGVLLLATGTIELRMVIDIMNFFAPINDVHESPVCNGAFSTCQLGSGGRFAVAGACCDFVASGIAFAAAFITIKRQCKTRGARAR